METPDWVSLGDEECSSGAFTLGLKLEETALERLIKQLCDELSAKELQLVFLFSSAPNLFQSCEAAGTVQPTDRSIAVFPFENASNDPNAEYLSEGISEALINSLAEVQ